MSTESADKPVSETAPAGASRPRPATSAGGAGPSRYSSGSSSYGDKRGRGPMGPAGQGGPAGRGRPMIRRRVCRICMERQGGVDWKAANFLRNFITERGKILSGRSTGTCSRCQRQLTQAIKRARNIALIPTSPI
ncbi:MAG: 30S ribosomal protein S18 [Elusimicrobia bacterium]|nr:30S ribosomal protein S18 [Elusimicrobiota bacterium]